MVGDIEKLCKKGDKVTMFVLGRPFEVEILASDVSDYERKYLVSFSDQPGDTKWINNSTMRTFLFLN